MNRTRSPRSSRHLAIHCVVGVLLLACTGVEEKRIRQLLHDKGFGTRAEGVATARNYVAGGDEVQFIVEPKVYLQPGHEQLFLLGSPQAVQLDGTIFVPYVGPLYVLGMTEVELSNTVNHMLGAVFTTGVQVQARIRSVGKAFYMFGEVGEGARYVPMLHGDLTLLEVIARAPVSKLANLGRVQVIKPDAQNPLVVVVNVREILETGNTTYNLRIDNNDIIYIPPTFFGHVSRFLEKLLQPLNVAVNALFGAAAIQSSYDFVFESRGNPIFFGNQGRGF